MKSQPPKENDVRNKKKPRNGTYSKGQERAVGILEAAERLLLTKGYHVLSLRNIAAEAQLSMSNLQYYYPNKDQLIQALIDKMIQCYLDEFSELLRNREDKPEEQFAIVVTHVINDLNKQRTTSFFPEMWALANHAGHVTEIMDDMYAKYRSIVQQVIQDINPDLSSEQTRKLALFITASIEGHTIFIGYGKPWTKDTADIINMAIDGFLYMIKNPVVK